jgi:hypothetical protein
MGQHMAVLTAYYYLRSVISTAPGLMSLDLQLRLFLLALSELGGGEAWNEVLEITVDADRAVTIERFGLPA